jgi:hypothetical protein
MEREGSLPSSQELSSCTYPEPDQSSPQHSILSLKRSILMLSIHLRLGLPSGLFLSGFHIALYNQAVVVTAPNIALTNKFAAM